MNRIIVFSNQFGEGKLQPISFEEIKEKSKPVTLVVVNSEKIGDFKKLSKELGNKNLISFGDYEYNPSDEWYVFSEVFVSSPEKFSLLNLNLFKVPALSPC